MRDDFDLSVADRFAVFDEMPVPDFWARVELKVLDSAPVPVPDADCDADRYRRFQPDRRSPQATQTGRRAVLRRRAARGRSRGRPHPATDAHHERRDDAHTIRQYERGHDADTHEYHDCGG